jgi:hypothetical protein
MAGQRLHNLDLALLNLNPNLNLNPQERLGLRLRLGTARQK